MFNNPYNTKESIEDFLTDISDPDEREARKTGLPLAFAGMVYKDFRYDKHVLQDVPKGWVDYESPPMDCCIFTSTDTHPKEDYRGLMCAVDQQQNIFIYRELQTKNDSKTYCEAILPLLRGRKVGWNKVEPAAWGEDSVHHDCIALDFMRNGFHIIKATKNREEGTQKVQAILREPRGFYVSPTCRGFLREMRNYCYDKKGKMMDKDDHFMECLYRLLFHRPTWFDHEESDEQFSVSEESFDNSAMFDFKAEMSFDLD
jgi:hypothetical protein